MLVYTTSFWNNLHEVHSKSKYLKSQIIYKKSLRARKPTGKECWVKYELMFRSLQHILANIIITNCPFTFKF